MRVSIGPSDVYKADESAAHAHWLGCSLRHDAGGSAGCVCACDSACCLAVRRANPDRDRLEGRRRARSQRAFDNSSGNFGNRGNGNAADQHHSHGPPRSQRTPREETVAAPAGGQPGSGRGCGRRRPQRARTWRAVCDRARRDHGRRFRRTGAPPATRSLASPQTRAAGLGTRPSSTKQFHTARELSSGDESVVSRRSSGCSGSSYGAETPVKLSSSPA